MGTIRKSWLRYNNWVPLGSHDYIIINQENIKFLSIYIFYNDLNIFYVFTAIFLGYIHSLMSLNHCQRWWIHQILSILFQLHSFIKKWLKSQPSFFIILAFIICSCISVTWPMVVILVYSSCSIIHHILCHWTWLVILLNILPHSC